MKREERVKRYMEILNKNEKNINKYPDYIMEYVRQNLGLDKYDTSEDKDINEMSKSDIFEKVCNWNNLYWYSEYIKSWIKDIYGIDLDKE